MDKQDTLEKPSIRSIGHAIYRLLIEFKIHIPLGYYFWLPQRDGRIPSFSSCGVSFVGGRLNPMRLFGSHFSSPSLTLGNASEVDRVVIPEALLRHYHPLGCVRIGPHSKIWEREIPEIRRKYSTR